MVCRAVFLLLALTAQVYGSDVIEFTDSNFDSEIVKHDTILVEFFAPWCGHCKSLAPHWEKAATELKGIAPLAKVDCIDAGKDTCKKNDVSGFPTLKLFKNGVFKQSYDGERKSDAIVSFMKKQVQPASVQITTKEAFAKIRSGEATVMVGFFESESSLKAQFLKAADQLRDDTDFFHTSSADLLALAEHKDAVVLYRPNVLQSKFEPDFVTFEGSSTSEIVTFFSKNRHGLVGLATSSNIASFPRPIVTVFFKVDLKANPKGVLYVRNRIAKVAKELPTITFSIGNKADFAHDVSEMKGDASSDSLFASAKNAQGKKFTMTKEYPLDSMAEFVADLKVFCEDFVAGKLKPYLKSEPIPTGVSGPVKVVVAENFDEIVMDSTNDVLIEFYAPWCGHCKSLEPKYNQLGEKLKNNNIVIAKMDATANDVPEGFEVRGFPTIYFLPAGKKDQPLKYEGDREVSSFISYLKKKATNPLVISDDEDTAPNKKKKKKTGTDSSKEEL